MKLHGTAKIHMVQMALVACIALPFSALAADLTVAQGDPPMTISTDTTYGAVVVNGDLTVAPNVTLTCTSLTVADNINGTATLTIGDRATVRVNGGSATKIGVGQGRAEVYLGTGAYFDAHSGYFQLCYGYESAPASDAAMTEALLVVGTNATVCCETDFCFGYNGNDNNNKPSSVGNGVVKAEVRLEKGATISAQRIDDMSPVSNRILFNGGSIVQRPSSTYTSGFIQMPYSAKNSSLYLEGTNGCPISINLSARNRHPTFFTCGSSSCRLVFCGDGGFLKTGDAVFPFVNPESYYDNPNPNLKFLFSGDFVIREGGFAVVQGTPTNTIFTAARNNYSRPVDLVVENGGTFDLAGCDIVMNSITAAGSGLVTNSSDRLATATVGVRDGSRTTTMARAVSGVSIVKQGASAMTLCDTSMDAVDMRAGSLLLKDRPRLGYSFYKFKVEEYGYDNGSNVQMRFHELSFLFAGEDVTRPYAALHHTKAGSSYVADPETLVDGDLSTIYYDLRIQKPYSDSDRDLVQLTVEYPECHPVDAYRWAPHKGSDGYKTNPTSWKFYGGMSKTDMTLLDQVDNFETTDALVADGWVATNFVCHYETAPVTIGSLTLAANIPVSVDGADVTVSSATAASGVPITLAHGATLTLPEETEISSLTIDLGNGGGTLTNFLPSENGAIYITRSPGVMARGVPLPVRVDNLVADRLYSWKIYIDGEIVENAQLTLNSDGYLVVRTGFILFVL